MASIELYQIVWLIALLGVNHVFIYAFDLYTRRRDGVKKIYALVPSDHQLKAEFRNSLITTPVHSLIIFLFLFAGLLQVTDERIGTILITFLVMFWWTELWHYVSHRAMHSRLLLSIHREHHKSHITNPMSAVSFSLLEKSLFTLGIVGFASFYASYFSFSFHGLCIYYTFYFSPQRLA